RRRCDRSPQCLHERRVARAAASDDELAPGRAAGRLALEPVGDGARGERDRGRKRVVARASVAGDASRELVGERLAEILAPGALRRALPEVLVAEGPAESALVDAAPRRAASGFVESVAVALR